MLFIDCIGIAASHSEYMVHVVTSDVGKSDHIEQIIIYDRRIIFGVCKFLIHDFLS